MDTGCGSRRSNPSRTASSKRPSSDPSEGSNAPKRSFKKPAPKKPSVNWNTMPLAEFQHRRKINPYANNRENFPGGELFWNRDQFLICEDVLRSKKNLYVLVQWIDLDHLRKDMSYFGEAIAMVEQLHITELISFHQDFDISIVAHFFATVHFHHDEARTMTWLTNGVQLTATWKDFMDLLQATWTKTFPGAEFLALDWVRHEPMKLCQKDKWANTSSRPAAPRDSDDDLPGAEDEAPPEAHRQATSNMFEAVSITSTCSLVTDVFTCRYFLSEKGDVISKPDSLPEIPPAKAPNTAVRPWTAAAAAGGASGPDEPCDARVVRELLRSTGLGEGEGEPRVVHQFLDLAYRYVGDVLGDAQVYADHAAKPQLDADDVRLAIQARVNFSFSQPPPREILMLFMGWFMSNNRMEGR
ncbi:transcription initiation factor TFIID subunit 9-like [Hordeum vulgare]|nr:transcription initiation factor TFIID subunit 9-like [Hordeum vulgare]